MKMKQKISSMITKYKRVWRLLKKPTKQEFLTISKIAGVGIAAIGVIGFVIALLMNFIQW